MTRIRGHLSVSRLLDLVLVAFVAIVFTTVAVDAILPVLGHPVVIITGSSMTPVVAIGSVVIEEPVSPAGLQVGDVASFRLGSGANVTHRVIRIARYSDGTRYETKGDANATADPTLLPSSAALGRVLFSIPWLGYFMWLLHVPSGILAVVSAALALHVASLLAEGEDVDGEAEPMPDAAGPLGVAA